LKLQKIYSAVLLKYTESTYKLLNIVDSYIIWGFVNKTLITDLVKKRGTSYSGSSLTLRELNNAEIESNLGKHNILCM
jgi:hypothetical protein